MFQRAKRIGSKSLFVAGALVTLLSLVACRGASQAPSGAKSPGNAVVRVIENEWSTKPNIASAPAGYVTFEVVNQGKTDHEVVFLKTDRAADKLVMNLDGQKVNETTSGESIGEIEAEAGVTQAATFNLAPGHYVLVCNVPAHYKQGMFANFTVTGTAPVASGAPKAAPKETGASEATKAPVLRTGMEVTNLNKVRPSLVSTLDALKAGDVAKARDAFDHLNPNDYNTVWHGMETYLSYRAPALYAELETVHQAKLTALLNDPKAKASDMIGEAQIMLALWDGMMVLVQTSPAITPLFDDLAGIRLLKAQTLTLITADLKVGDVASAKALYTEFMGKWADIEDLFQQRSPSDYAEIEAAMAKVNTAFQKSSPDAAELTPLVANLLARYNYGQALVNAAARNADLTKTTFAPEDAQAAARLAAIAAEIQASLTSWKSGNYQDAGARAQNAGGTLFANVSAALKARNGADAALKKALDAYAAVAAKAGDATTVSTAQQAALDAAGVAQQVLVGQFWTDSKLQDAIRQAAR